MTYNEKDKEKYDPKYLTPGDAISIIAHDSEAVKSIEIGVDDAINGRVTRVNNLRDILNRKDKKQ